MREFKFIKMNGLGNDFVIIDQRKNTISLSKKDIVSVCDRDDGVGCDQLINILPRQDDGNILIEFFNSDGEEIHACGNGSRCVADLLMTEENVDSIKLSTKEKTISCQRIGDNCVSIDMGIPNFELKKIPVKTDIDLNSLNFQINNQVLANPFFVNVGNPHVIFFVNEISDYRIEEIGPVIENDLIFPEKINVSLCKIVNKELIDLVVWERGAGKTLACGTAACAAAVAAVTNNHVSEKIQVRLPGGILDINYSKGKTVVMSGPTEINFNGEYKIN
tara:strand:- start:1671 stop:2498 length:828 start_codon:yes stop_codon:yes gene_type:complete